MKKIDIPLSVKERHRILFSKDTDRNVLVEIGKAYFERNLLYDALEYFEKLNDVEYLTRIKEKSIEEADLLLYEYTMKALKKEMEKDELLKLRDNAQKMGKHSVASNVLIFLISKGEKANA